jgi:hypothetical protein
MLWSFAPSGGLRLHSGPPVLRLIWAGVPGEFFKQILLCQPRIAPQRSRHKKLALALRAGRHRWNLVRVLEDDEGMISHDGEQCATLWEAAPLHGPVRQSELSEPLGKRPVGPGRTGLPDETASLLARTECKGPSQL